MFGQGYLSSILQKQLKSDPATQFTVGRVIDTNDPQQMGRVRVQCSAWGDHGSKLVRDIPFAMPVSPLAGLMMTGKRGAEEAEVDGPVSYGMWNIPKIGSYVIVGCIDGHRGRRFYIGGIHPQFMTHTMPHGRYTWQDQANGKPDGPLDTHEKPIEPLYSNLTAAFTPRKSTTEEVPGTSSVKPRENLEWRSRGLDRQTSGITNEQTANTEDGPGNKVADTKPGEPIKITQEDGSTYELDGPGYSVSQVIEGEKYDSTGTGYDSQVYSWTTPGFHAFSMDDRKDNCRIRLRTTSGHQIIMDDTNERIYISAAGGESWIEIDKVGNIDIYASKNISTHAGGDINFFSDKSIRMQAKEGIHMRTDDEFRIHAVKDFHVRSELNIRTYSGQETRMESTADMHVLVQGSTFIGSTGPIHVGTQGTMHLSSTGRLNLTSGNWIVGDAQQVHWNSAVATPASAAQEALEIQANWTSRVPEHEPWARVFMKESDSDATATNKVNKHTPEYSYTDQLVGKGGRGDTYERNKYWHR